jgi:quinol monooxygenase YgiN
LAGYAQQIALSESVLQAGRPEHLGRSSNAILNAVKTNSHLMEMQMFGTVATIKIKEGKAAEFEKIATELVNKVNENEKGCLLYQLYYGEVPNTYVFMERYADQAAVEAHRSTEYFKTLGRAMAEFMDGKPTIQRLKQVGRFKQVGA